MAVSTGDCGSDQACLSEGWAGLREVIVQLANRQMANGSDPGRPKTDVLGVQVRRFRIPANELRKLA